MEGFRLCITSPPTLDTADLRLFRCWCSGITPNESWQMLAMRALWDERQSESGLEFPLLRYRMKRFKEEQYVRHSLPFSAAPGSWPVSVSLTIFVNINVQHV